MTSHIIATTAPQLLDLSHGLTSQQAPTPPPLPVSHVDALEEHLTAPHRIHTHLFPSSDASLCPSPLSRPCREGSRRYSSRSWSCRCGRGSGRGWAGEGWLSAWFWRQTRTAVCVCSYQASKVRPVGE